MLETPEKVHPTGTARVNARPTSDDALMMKPSFQRFSFSSKAVW
jgi:hypothetical protein